jgi:hypothetical protein
MCGESINKQRQGNMNPTTRKKKIRVEQGDTKSVPAAIVDDIAAQGGHHFMFASGGADLLMKLLDVTEIVTLSQLSRASRNRILALTTGENVRGDRFPVVDITPAQYAKFFQEDDPERFEKLLEFLRPKVLYTHTLRIPHIRSLLCVSSNNDERTQRLLELIQCFPRLEHVDVRMGRSRVLDDWHWRVSFDSRGRFLQQLLHQERANTLKTLVLDGLRMGVWELLEASRLPPAPKLESMLATDALMPTTLDAVRFQRIPFGRALQRVALDWSNRAGDNTPLQRLVESCPNLTALSVRGGALDEKAHLEALDLLLSTYGKQLREFEWGPPFQWEVAEWARPPKIDTSARLVQWLSSAECKLVSLSMEFAPFSAVDNDDTTTRKRTFLASLPASLHELHLVHQSSTYSNHWKATAEMLEQVAKRCPALRVLDVIPSGHHRDSMPDVKTWRSILERMPRLRRVVGLGVGRTVDELIDLLTHFNGVTDELICQSVTQYGSYNDHARLKRDWTSPDHPYVVRPKVELRPRAWHRLRVLELHHDYTTVLTDGWISSITAAAPELRVLFLKQPRISVPAELKGKVPPRVTDASLMAIAKNCTYLQELRLDFQDLSPLCAFSFNACDAVVQACRELSVFLLLRLWHHKSEDVKDFHMDSWATRPVPLLACVCTDPAECDPSREHVQERIFLHAVFRYPIPFAEPTSPWLSTQLDPVNDA